MFKPGGSWKEFGIGRGDTHTVIPFWLVAIFWAFISYGVSLVILSNFANLALAPFQSSVPAIQMPQMYQQLPTSSVSNNTVLNSLASNASVPTQSTIRPVSSMIGLEKNVPGYYVLSNNGPNGVPQYMYYGNSPPNLSKY